MKLKVKPKVAAKHLVRSVQSNSPTILSAVAVVGVAATGYLTWKASRQHVLTLAGEAYNQGVSGEERRVLSKGEEIEKVWKLYIPAVATGVGTVGCIVLSNRIAARRAAAILAAYGVLSGDFDDYRNKAAEMLGAKKTDELEAKLAEQKMVEKPPPAQVVLEEGKSWFCDLGTMRYIMTDRPNIDKARNDLNYQLLHEGPADLNDMYSYIGLEATGVGDMLGWDQEQQVEVIYSAVLMPNGAAATGFKFNPEPRPDFDDLH